MSTKIKGIYKGFKCITQIFVVKDREIEIGYPTDVKHVAHIGWDGPSGSSPSWMNEFKTVPDFAASSIGNINETRSSSSALSPWSSQDYDTIERQPASDMMTDPPRTDLPNIPKQPKSRRKKNGSPSSPKSSPSSARSSRAAKSKSKFADSNNMKTTNVEVV